MPGGGPRRGVGVGRHRGRHHRQAAGPQHVGRHRRSAACGARPSRRAGRARASSHAAAGALRDRCRRATASSPSGAARQLRIAGDAARARRRRRRGSRTPGTSAPPSTGMVTGCGPNTQASRVLSGAAARAVAIAVDQVGGRLPGRRRAHRQHAVDPVVVRAAPSACGRGRRRTASNPRSIVLARTRAARPSPASPTAARTPSPSSASVSPASTQASAASASEPPPLPDQRHPGAGRQRLAGEHPGHVELLRQRVDPDHAGLLEQGVQRVRRQLAVAGIGPGRARRSARRRWAWCATPRGRCG